MILSSFLKSSSILSSNFGWRQFLLLDQNANNSHLSSVSWDIDKFILSFWELFAWWHSLDSLSFDRLEAFRNWHQSDLLGQVIDLEGNDTLRDTLAHDHSQDGQDYLHSLWVLVIGQNLVVVELLNEGVSELQVVFSSELGQVVRRARRWCLALERFDNFHHLWRSHKLQSLTLQFLDCDHEEWSEELLHHELSSSQGFVRLIRSWVGALPVVVVEQFGGAIINPEDC